MGNEAGLADILQQARRTRTAVGKLTDDYPLDLAGAYRVQRLGIDQRVASGERIVGVKMGFTSKAKMAQMGVDDVIWGILTDAMAVPGASSTGGAGGTTEPRPYDLSGLIHPKVEPEIVFRLGRRVENTDDVDSAVDAIAVGYEVLDSRFEGYKFTLPDVVADNASAAGFGIGEWHAVTTQAAQAAAPAPRLPDISDLPVTLAVDGQPVRTASTAAILGDPWESLRAAARLATRAGLALEAGWIVLAGGITEAVPLTPGAVVTVTAETLGAAELRCATTTR
jgi:2-oxo-3-hexenedioate decarboxylase